MITQPRRPGCPKGILHSGAGSNFRIFYSSTDHPKAEADKVDIRPRANLPSVISGPTYDLSIRQVGTHGEESVNQVKISAEMNVGERVAWHLFPAVGGKGGFPDLD